MATGDDLEPRAAGARRFRDKIAIVTGAGQGIGRATARRLAQEGAAVVVADLVAASAEAFFRDLAAREIPLGRSAQAEEQAAAIAFLASDDASFITGQILPVGGGAT